MSQPDDGDDVADPGDVKDPVDAFVSEEEMRAIDDKIITLADELEGLEVCVRGDLSILTLKIKKNY